VPDKKIRRRRAVLALLVVVSLILLTVYYSTSDDNALHSVQNDAVAVLSPIQKGASKVLSPVRDVFGFISSTVHAKSQNSELKRTNETLRSQLDQALTDQAQFKADQKALKLDASDNISNFDPVNTTVIAKDSSLWYTSVEIGVGSNEGVAEYDPVVGNGALIGNISEVYGSVSYVRLLGDEKFAVGAMALSNGTSYSGIIEPKVGNPQQLVLTDLPANATISSNSNVVCSGFKEIGDTAIRSYCPAGIPIGTVSTQNTTDALADSQQLSVTPVADLQHLSVVQVLTRPQASTVSASLP
jgi:rod shape-determining protein MreC